MKRITCLMLAILVALGAAAMASNAEYKMDVAGPMVRPVEQPSTQPHTPGLYQAGKAALTEGFETAVPPTGWRTVNVLGTNVWNRSTAQFHSGAASAYISYQGTGGEDWLITPPMYPQTALDSLTFWARKSLTSNYPPDSLLIKVSTTDSNLASFTTTILAIEVNSLTNSVWNYLMASLGAFNGQRIFVAFQHKDYDGNGVYIDDVTGAELTAPSFDHDMKVNSIDAPTTAIVAPRVVIYPAFTLKNSGNNPETGFGVNCCIYDSLGAELYNHSGWFGTADTLAPDSLWSSFFGTIFTPDSFSRYQVVFASILAGDENPLNDTMKFNFRTYDRNVGATAIVVPAGVYVNKDSTIAPRATYHNFATEVATFDAYFQIDFGGGPIYLENVNIADLAPGADTTIIFPNWTAPHDVGTHQVYAYTSLELDLNPANDTTSKTITTAPIWQYVANVPNDGGAYTRWSYGGSCVSNNMLWMVGGRRDAGWAVLNDVGNYNPATNTWDDTTPPALAQARVYLTAAGNDQYVYALGGRDGAGAIIYRAVERLESPAGTSWIYVDSLPAGRVFGAATIEGNYMYYVGGTSDAGAATATNTLWRYDVTADTSVDAWETTLTQMPVTMDAGDVAAMNGKLYMPGDATNNTTYIYDITSDTWDSVSNGAMPAASMYKAVAMHGKVWRIGGSAAGASTNAVWELDTVSGTWTDISKPMLQTRISFGAGVVNGTVVSAGGVAFPGFAPTMTTESIDISYMGISGKPSVVTAPGTFTLSGNYPNPFRSATSISFQLPKAGRVRIEVYNIAGQKVKTLLNTSLNAGYHGVTWNGRNDAGQAVAAGMYMYRMVSDNFSATRKLVLVK